MEFKVRPIEIPDGDDPFKNDKLERKSEIENLSNLVRNMNPPDGVVYKFEMGDRKAHFYKNVEVLSRW